MNNEESKLINALFERLRSADSAPKDRDAEQLIQQKVAAQPTAPYLMAQTVLVQEQALNNAQTRIKELETRLADAAKEHAQSSGGGGSFLSNLFGGKPAANNPPPAFQSATPPPMTPPAASYPGGGYPASYQPVPAPAPAGGGFLRTALAAAAGVAGGSLLYDGLENMLGHHASTFGSPMGMGGNFLDTGFGGGRPTEIIENREVINNYYDNEDRGGSTYARTGGGDAISNSDDNGPYSSPPRDDPADVSDNFTAGNSSDDENGPNSSPPQDDPSDNFADSADNSAGDFGSGYDSSGSNDDTLV